MCYPFDRGRKQQTTEVSGNLSGLYCQGLQQHVYVWKNMIVLLTVNGITLVKMHLKCTALWKCNGEWSWWQQGISYTPWAKHSRKWTLAKATASDVMQLWCVIRAGHTLSTHWTKVAAHQSIDPLPSIPWTITMWLQGEGGKAEAGQMRGKPPGSWWLCICSRPVYTTESIESQTLHLWVLLTVDGVIH